MKAIIFPGQGAQFRGMGRGLFEAWPAITAQASEILGYSIEKLCLDDVDNQLRLTQFTQPALYVANALAYYKMRDSEPNFRVDFLAGHSLGEYNALLAAEAFSFETGLKLVKKRGELMGAAVGGGMAAVVGSNSDEIRALLQENNLDDIDLANFNTPRQLVIAGKMDSIIRAEKVFSAKSIRCVVLNVSAAFHSRHMASMQQVFGEYLRSFTFNRLTIPVIANATARPYADDQVENLLERQIASPVLWTDTIRYLMGKGDLDYVEVGANILGKMVAEIRRTETPILVQDTPAPTPAAPAAPATPAPAASVAASTISPAPASGGRISAHTLGSALFRQRFGLKYAYMSGAMYRGIGSAKLVIRMGKAGLMGFFGSGGLSLQDIEKAIISIQSELNQGQPYGINLLANYVEPEAERATVELFFKYGVHHVEAAAFMKVTPSIVLFRLKGMQKGPDGNAVCMNHVLAKVSRPEVAEAFMSPAPDNILEGLLSQGLITPEQLALAKTIPVSQNICIEADSGGHTDGGIPSVMLPAMRKLRDQMMAKYGYADPICMGLAGGIGTPEAAAAAFVMGADFILTGSINQCTVEGGISADAKDLLQDINIQDTEYAPAGDMFEIGAKVQVLRKGVFFPSRANKLFALYSHHNSLDEIPEKIQKQLQSSFFKKTFAEIWNETKAYLTARNQQHEIAKAEANPKFKMALVFRWYFGYSSRLSFEGKGEDRVNYQIHCGPALGAFNQWVKGTDLEPWTNRHVDEIGEKLMLATADYLNNRFAALGAA